jgi:putative Mg2+ transporter-C (MgtC) family protein
MFERGAVMAEDDLRRLIGEHGFSIANLSYHLSEGGKFFEYGMVIKSRDRRNADALSESVPATGSARIPYRPDGRPTTLWKREVLRNGS